MPSLGTAALNAAYKSLREKQLAQSLAGQLDAFGSLVRETSPRAPGSEVRKPHARPHLPPNPKPKPVPRASIFFTSGPPYTYGEPNPQNAIRTPSDPSGGAYYNSVELGNPQTGGLSVGVAAGLMTDPYPPRNTNYSELPERWLFGDAISASASILEVVKIPVNLNPGSSFNTTSLLAWDYWEPSTSAADLMVGCLENTPGTDDSALGGFLGVSMVAELTVSVASESEILNSEQASISVLSAGVDANSYGNTSLKYLYGPTAPYLFLDFAFAQSEFLYLQAEVPFVKGGTQLLVETTVRLVGARGGVNDPNAGWVTAAFLDINGHGASPVSDVPLSPDPIVVRRISVNLTPY